MMMEYNLITVYIAFKKQVYKIQYISVQAKTDKLLHGKKDAATTNTSW